MLKLHFINRFAPCFLVAFLCLPFVGCSDMKVAPVSGTITLDGTPLPRASVLFQPEAGGRPSSGFTDANGRYQLGYSMSQEGAEVGKCSVKISTAVEEGDYGSKKSKELVPKRYDQESPVIVEILSKSNTIDIKLTTDP